MTTHEKFMSRCIQLAYNGLGSVYPNPMVGSVLVHDGQIIGEGWHKKAGEAHAEVIAISSVKDKELLPESTLYVTLEPCSHHGKTPPCADRIIAEGIRKIVVGSRDPFAQVNGKGIKKLQDSDCEVITGILEKECNELNKRFFTFHNKKRPYIFLKWAETANGYIAPMYKENKTPVWISNTYSKSYVHKMRSVEQAILVGTHTVLDDNPKLNTRDWNGKSPLRLVIDKELKIPITFSVWDDSQETIFLTEDKKWDKPLQNTYFENVTFTKNIPEEICNLLYSRNIQSLVVEGGKTILQQFIDLNLWDEAIIFVGKGSFPEGLPAPVLTNKHLKKIDCIENDTMFLYSNTNQ